MKAVKVCPLCGEPLYRPDGSSIGWVRVKGSNKFHDTCYERRRLERKHRRQLIQWARFHTTSWKHAGGSLSG